MQAIQMAIVRAMVAATYSPMLARYLDGWAWRDRIGMVRDLVLLMLGLWRYDSGLPKQAGAVAYLQDVLSVSRGTASRILLHLRDDGESRYLASTRDVRPDPQDGPRYVSYADVQARYAEDMGLITIDGDADESELLVAAGDLDTLTGPMSSEGRQVVIDRLCRMVESHPDGPADRLLRSALPTFADLQDLRDLLSTSVRPIREVRSRKSNGWRYPSWYAYAQDRVAAYRRDAEERDSYWRLAISGRDDKVLRDDPAGWLASHAA